MIDERLFFGKTGNGVYISNLDMNRMMQRALKRSGLPVWYSQGYNPHIYCSFPLALPLGVSSTYEIMDFRLDSPLEQKQVLAALRRAVPPDFPAYSVAPPEMTVKTIGSCDYTFSFEALTEAARQQLAEFLSWPEILMDKKTQQGMKQINLVPLLLEHRFVSDAGAVSLQARLSAGCGETLSPVLLLSAMRLYCPSLSLEETKICRTAIHNADGALFV